MSKQLPDREFRSRAEDRIILAAYDVGDLRPRDEMDLQAMRDFLIEELRSRLPIDQWPRPVDYIVEDAMAIAWGEVADE